MECGTLRRNFAVLEAIRIRKMLTLTSMGRKQRSLGAGFVQ